MDCEIEKCPGCSKRCETAKEFVDYFLDNGWFTIRNLGDAVRIGRGGLIFRGQCDISLPLFPSAFRFNSKLDSYAYQAPPALQAGQALGSERERTEYLYFHLFAEIQAVRYFIESADSLGISVPLDFQATESHFKYLVDVKTRYELTRLREFPAQSLERVMAFAQHYGVPTRLLDWSESPLVAAYFAAYEVSSAAKVIGERARPERLGVIFLSTRQLNSTGSSVRIVRAPRHDNLFLRQQEGVFTSLSEANPFFLQHGRWPSLEDYESGVRLERVCLVQSEANELLRRLFHLGISRQSLMPSLNHAAEAFSYKKSLFG